MGRYSEELVQRKLELKKAKKELEEKNSLPRSRKAQFVTIKTISEIFPDFAVTEASLILADKPYKMTFQIDDYEYNSCLAGKSFEIIKSFKDYYILSDSSNSIKFPKEWTKEEKTKSVRIIIDMKPLKTKIKDLEYRIAQLPLLIEMEIKDEKEAERQRRKEMEKEMCWWKYSKKIEEELTEVDPEYLNEILEKEYNLFMKNKF